MVEAILNTDSYVTSAIVSVVKSLLKDVQDYDKITSSIDAIIELATPVKVVYKYSPTSTDGLNIYVHIIFSNANPPCPCIFSILFSIQNKQHKKNIEWGRDFSCPLMSKITAKISNIVVNNISTSSNLDVSNVHQGTTQP